MKKYAISTSDGHDEDWSYYDSEEDARNEFERMKEYESDIHLYEYGHIGGDEYNYEVIDSFWDEEDDV